MVRGISGSMANGWWPRWGHQLQQPGWQRARSTSDDGICTRGKCSNGMAKSLSLKSLVHQPLYRTSIKVHIVDWKCWTSGHARRYLSMGSYSVMAREVLKNSTCVKLYIPHIMLCPLLCMHLAEDEMKVKNNNLMCRSTDPRYYEKDMIKWFAGNNCDSSFS